MNSQAPNREDFTSDLEFLQACYPYLQKLRMKLMNDLIMNFNFQMNKIVKEMEAAKEKLAALEQVIETYNIDIESKKMQQSGTLDIAIEALAGHIFYN